MFKRIYDFVRADLKYNYLKNLPEEEYAAFLKKEYYQRTGEELNIEEPRKYTEKVQYAKLYLNTPLKTKLSDKYAVREWIEEKIGSEYLIPLLGVWSNFSEIDFDQLPNRFVLKLNSGSGTNIVVKDKNQLNKVKAKIKFDRWVKKNFAFSGDIQPHYASIQPKIIAEEFIEDKNGKLIDYKFFCFDGKVYYCWVTIETPEGEYRNVYDLEWNLQPWKINIYDNYPGEIPKPENFEHMVEIAKELSQGFSHVRVDLYNVDGKIYFGEMTFTSGSGYSLIYPEEYNEKLGDLWKLEN